MKLASGPAAALAVAALPGLLVAQSATDTMTSLARQVHDRAIVIDGHADTPQRMIDKRFDIGVRHADGNVDIPRMRDGGLDALFFSIWVPGTVTGPSAVKRALEQIAAVRDAVRTHPNDLSLALTAADIRRAVAEHKVAALMGVEGGHMINSDLGVLRTYASLGVRYLTLTHNYNTAWAITGGESDNIIAANTWTGRVILIGLGGDDNLTGGEGNDLLLGGDGDDVLIGGKVGID